MYQSGLHNACTCARCLALRPARVIGFNPDLAAPYRPPFGNDTSYSALRRAQAQARKLHTPSVFHVESAEYIDERVLDAIKNKRAPDIFEARSDATDTYHDKADWWHPEREARRVQEYAMGVFELSLTIMAALGLALIVWAIHEAAR